MSAQDKSSAASSCARAAVVNARRTVSFNVRAFNERLAKGSCLATHDNTVETGHTEHNFACGGRNSKIPFMKQETNGMLPICVPSTGSWYREIQALYTPIVL
jgi:hypothetical protein